METRSGNPETTSGRKHAAARVRHGGFALLLLPVVLSFTGCTFLRLVRSSDLKTPGFSYIRCDVTSISDRAAFLEFRIAARNPNAIGLRNVFVDYELSFENKRFLKGGSVELSLAPGGETLIRVPAEAVYEEILRAAGPAAAQVLMGRESLPVKVDGVVRGNPTVYNEAEAGSLFQFAWRFTRTEEIPIPKEQRELARKRAAKAFRKLF